MAASAFMLIGPVGAGKSSLFRVLCGRDEGVRKTQAVEFDGSGIDTPGEYFSYPRLYHALINTSSDVDTLVYVHPADDPEFRLPPGLLSVYMGKRLVVAITKTDLPDADPDGVERVLRGHGLEGPFFRTTNSDPLSAEPLKQYLLGTAPAMDAGRPRSAPL